jgi:hypothetical protein
MDKCECITGCSFSNDKISDSSGLGSMNKRKYWLGNYSDCAGYIFFKKLGKPMVPADLYSNMRDRAEQIIAQ